MCSESALCPSLCSVVAIVTVVLGVNVALLVGYHAKTFQQRTTGAVQVHVAFVHLLGHIYSTVVLLFFTVNFITGDTLWARTGHVYYNACYHQVYKTMIRQCKYLAPFVVLMKTPLWLH